MDLTKGFWLFMGLSTKYQLQSIHIKIRDTVQCHFVGLSHRSRWNSEHAEGIFL